MGIDNYMGRSNDLTEYRAWHDHQDEILRRLQEAVERGGQEELEAEKERIVREDAERLYNGTLERL